MGGWAKGAHRGLSWLLLLGIVAQFYAAGLMVYGAPLLHQTLGYVVLLGSAVWTVLARVALGWGSEAKWGIALVVVLTAQPVIVFVLAERSLYAAALHPVNGLLAFTIVMGALRRPLND